MAKESVAIGQEPPCPAVRKRKKRTPKSGVETVTTVAMQKVRSHRTGFLPFQNHFLYFLWFNGTLQDPKKNENAPLFCLS